MKKEEEKRLRRLAASAAEEGEKKKSVRPHPRTPWRETALSPPGVMGKRSIA